MKKPDNSSIRSSKNRTYRPSIDIRGVATRRAKSSREFGVLADRLYFGARGHCRTGVQHFSV